MKQSHGTITRTGTSADDLAEWDLLRTTSGPFVSAYLDTAMHDVASVKETSLAWRDAEAGLRAKGAPRSMLDPVAEHLVDAHLRAAAVAVVVGPNGVALARDLDEPLGEARFDFAAVPTLTPLLRWLQGREAHVVVVVDHAGADLAVFDRHNGSRTETLGEPDHSDRELHHAKPGGWSQPRYQRRTKGRWRANAGEAAQRLIEIVDELHPRIIGVGGDVRSVQMFVEQLPSVVREQIWEVHGSRASDGSARRHEDDVSRMIRTVVAEDTVVLAQKFAEELGQRDLAVSGAADTLAALGEARAATLLVHDDPADGRTAWFADDLVQASTDRDDLHALGAASIGEGRLVDVAVRTAFATGASVRVVPRIAVLHEGIGATLRH